MSRQDRPLPRRTLLLSLAAAPGLVLLAAAQGARAAGTIPQANAKYQDHPQGAQRCDLCTYYIAGAKPKAPGACKLVAGAIAPEGWCQLFAKKPG